MPTRNFEVDKTISSKKSNPHLQLPALRKGERREQCLKKMCPPAAFGPPCTSCKGSCLPRVKGMEDVAASGMEEAAVVMEEAAAAGMENPATTGTRRLP
jgi:hypothetical protein